MKILITGGAGFIGSAVIRDLFDNTDHEIINVDCLTYAGNLSSIPRHVLVNERYSFEKINICNFQDIKNIFKKYQPDKVMHLAAESHVDKSIESPNNFINTNIFGTYNMLEHSRAYWSQLEDNKARNFRFHHISTDEVYGDLGMTEDLFKENTSYDPSSPYSATKASSDHLVRAWHRTFNLPIVVTNCSNNYGPYHFPEKLIPNVILNALNGNPISIYGDGSQIRDWLYVEDHARALYKVLLNGAVGETYNIGGGNQITNLNVVKIICDHLDTLVTNKPKNISKFSDLIRFVEDRPGHDIRYAIDASKINNKLNWFPKEDFASGILKTINWYINNLDWCNDVLSGNYKLQRQGLK